MLVRNWMSPDPVTVAPEAEVGEARRLMRYYGVRHLPVVDGSGKVIGMVSDRDVRIDDSEVRRLAALGRIGDATGEGQVVEAVMSAPVHTVGVDEPVEAAARLMLSRRVSALPVVDADRVMQGLITTTDCLLASLTPSGDPQQVKR